MSAGEEDNNLIPLSAFLPGIAGAVKLAQPPKLVTLQGRHHHTVSKQIEELLAIPQDVQFRFSDRTHQPSAYR